MQSNVRLGKKQFATGGRQCPPTSPTSASPPRCNGARLLMAELIATVALIISIAVAAAAVSMGIANAEVPFLALG